MMHDSDNPMIDSPYSWRETRDEVRIYWNDALAAILRKDRASKFLMKISEADNHEAQLIMAKVTGNFKRGNERRSSDKPTY